MKGEIMTFGSPGACATSGHSKGRHMGPSQSSTKVVKRLPRLGRPGETFESVSYVDRIVCACGAEHDQEWSWL